MPDQARAPGDNRDSRTPAVRGAVCRSELFVRRSQADTALQRRATARSSGASLRSLRFEHVRPANGVIGRHIDSLDLGLVARALDANGVPADRHRLLDHGNGPEVASVDEERSGWIRIHRDITL